ncbi:unnamed protein product [Clonostachys rhizophaga]|uniref:Aminotransferase class V domain-containing protein n=1 Tax=Clonostachys rhizophaga TaxID=160324 RepID=A0A9N9VH26_9HYPO|nr:unnamed protein product [Clonostachys rhizophaga]
MGQKLSAADTSSSEAPRELGHGLLKEFQFDEGWRNLNHGSYGTIPKAISQKRREYLDRYEARPDVFIRRDVATLVNESRAAVAQLVNAPLRDVVFVGNATEGVNTVLRNLHWSPDGRDVIISFGTIYDAMARAEDFVVDYFKDKVVARDILLTYPVEDDEILRLFRETVRGIEAEGKRARVAVFDVVSSNPGVVFPWEAMTAACRELGVLSLVDGAQGIGMVHLDLKTTDPDFFVSNCHKWLHVPRGCAVFYVPERNHKLIPSSLATSRGYVPQEGGRALRTQPLPDYGEVGHLAFNFGWVGTRDDSPYMCVKDAIAWRRDVLGGEERILAYLWDLNKRGIRHVAGVLGTEYLDNKTGTMTNCGMGNVALPLWVAKEEEDAEGEGERVTEGGGQGLVLSREEANAAFNFMAKALMDEYKTFVALYVRWDRFWVRISAQVYLEMEDYEWLAKVLKELAERVVKGEFRGQKQQE